MEMLCGMFPDIEASVVAMVLESCDGDVSMAAVDLTNMQAINDAEQASKRAAEGCVRWCLASGLMFERYSNDGNCD